MGKHSVKANRTVRNSAVIAAVGVSAAVLAPASAQAAQAVHIPSGFSFDIPDEFAAQAQPHLAQAGVQLNGVAQQAAVSPLAEKIAAPVAGNQKVADSALSQVGAPYQWGGTSPAGFDCSGLVQWAFAQHGKKIPRTSSAQIAGGSPVSLSNIQVGDVVGYYGGNSHVAIYIGDGKVVHAINSGTPVKVTDMNYMPVNSVVRF
ncbi:endopeptidase [Corynebacterium sp. zg254]|uniref:NlpC/P60 family protein n=1 Tax=Corynebacterium zhongnanshanii TaxID=2768834 RepID=A0ABQ6VD47_9CORY|nr:MULTISPECIES: NlpC/P60 family protein [Corynebacterium]KAB3520837.1 NlpC/P60 family protein [Corynebacterium zhongnanshanii]MCR5914459.1 endopeptidase [Corynebacterium sp. zg254]